MSIYIKGMKLPTDEPRRLVIYPDGRIYDAAGFFRIDATAEQLPPHGRLKDVDKLHSNMYKWDGLTGNYYINKEQIESAPTIIEAEEE